MPYAFTEQGIYMLMTVLKGEQATAQSKALIRLFKQMKDQAGRSFFYEKEHFMSFLWIFTKFIELFLWIFTKKLYIYLWIFTKGGQNVL